MKNKLYYYLIAIFLLLIIAFFAWRKSKIKSTLNVGETEFAVSDTAVVTKIFFADKNNHRITLERKSQAKWVVNNEFTVRKDLMMLMLATLKQLSIKAPAPKAARNNVVKDLSSIGIKVEIYENEKLKKTFFVGETSPDQLSTYMLMEGSENPYLVELPGQEVVLRTRFFLNVIDWRSRELFNTPAHQIASLKVDYSSVPEESFEIKQQQGTFSIEGSKSIDIEKVKSYLSVYSSIYIENFITEGVYYGKNDSILKQTPFCEIRLIDMDNTKSSLLVFKIEGDADRAIGFMGDKKEMVFIQIQNLNKLLAKKQFFNKDEQ